MVPLASLAFLGGLLTGSFVSVVAHRVPRGRLDRRAALGCPACGTQIAAYDNVPVLSWLLLRGRCRCCGARIPPRYPLTELGVGAAFAATVLVLHDDPAELALGLVFVAMLVAITLTDLERRVIPNAILLVGAVIGARDRRRRPTRAACRSGVAAAAAGGGFLLRRRARLSRAEWGWAT